MDYYRDRNYKEMVEEYGQEFAAALLEEEYNQYIRSVRRAPADCFDFEVVEYNESLY